MDWKKTAGGVATLIPGSAILFSILNMGTSNVDNHPLLFLLLFIVALSIVIGFYLILYALLEPDVSRDKVNIYNLLYIRGRCYKTFIKLDKATTLEIAHSDRVNLSPERVREICNLHEGIERDIYAQHEELWKVRDEYARKTKDEGYIAKYGWE